MAALLLRIILVVSLAIQAVYTRRIILERQRALQDQVGAASGYVYKSDSNGPTSYMQYTSGPANFGYPPLTLGSELDLTNLPPITYHQHPHQPVPQYIHQYAQPLQQHNVALQQGLAGIDEEAAKYAFAGQQQQHHLGQVPIVLAPAAQSHISGGGNTDSASHHSAGGEKGEKGYKSSEDYDKAAKGQHSKENHKGQYETSGGNKDGNHEVASHYDSSHAEGKGSKGGSFSDKSSHRKGSKTTGFHKVYHKDEYKKDHTFYDEADNSGEFEKFGKGEGHKSAEKGGYKKGGHHSSEYDQGKHGKQGYYDEGNHESKDSGHKGEQGVDKYYEDQSEYKKDGGESGGKKYDYSDDDKDSDEY